MNEFKGHKIQGIIDDINKTQAMIELHAKHEDAVSAFMAKQYDGVKRKLFKELLAEMMLADLSYQEMEHFIQKLAAYLKQSDVTTTLPKELKSNLAKVEKLMSA
ncbi:MAG: hypothetical protein MUC59_07680 [Saprospiraceae bacterium]|jgi:IS4 transposase|nr:hypothetical protein [Saprospiraceae bacterium]